MATSPRISAVENLLRPSLLIVDHQVSEAARVARFFEGEGFAVHRARTGEQAFNLLDRQALDGILTETRAPGIDGLRLMEVARRIDPEACVMLIADPESLGAATRALLDGAWDVQTRPIILEKALAVLRRARRVRELIAQLSELNRRLDRKYGVRNIVGTSPGITAVLEKVQAAGPTDATVLITGETGTGKELVAAALHQNSPRRNGPWIKLHCGELSEGLVESELFGHERGAFTGAVRARKGRFELADGGTLFLDEVGELAPGTQVRLLRVLQEREFVPVGGEQPVRVDVRVLAATNRDLRRLVAQGRFREDLYYRLNVISIEIPALRHRPQDIPLLAEHLVREAAEAHGKSIPGIAPRALSRLSRFPWPGNVRELKNAILGMVIHAEDGRPLDVDDLPRFLQALPDEGRGILVPLGTPLAEVERRLIEAHLREAGDDLKEAARALGISLRTMYRRVSQYHRGPEGEGPG